MTLREQPTETLQEWLELLKTPRGLNKQAAHANMIKIRAIEMILAERKGTS